MPAKAILLMGPTGAGKTDFALELADRWPVGIISVDSAMVYRGMDVGTGKPPRSILGRVPHHLVDIVDPADPYSAGRFVRDAIEAIRVVQAQGRVPLLVGGTMLYFRALTAGLAELPAADPEVRAGIEREAALKGWSALHAQLETIDPPAAVRILPNDAQRIQRAIEVFRLTGRPLSEWQTRTRPPLPAMQWMKIAVNPSERAVLYDRIERRFHAMLAAGFLEEVRALHARSDLHAELPALRSVGYRQLYAHLAGEVGWETAVANGIKATRHLARRQLIWLRNESEVEWIDSLDSGVSVRINALVARVIAGSSLP